MSGLTEDQIKKALADAQVLDHHAVAKPPPIVHVHHLNGCDIDVGDQRHENGVWSKRLVFRHRGGEHQWIVDIPLAGAQAIAKELAKPPRVPDVAGNGGT